MEIPQLLNTNWPIGKKIVFLFIFIYTILYFFPFPVDEIPHSEFITGYYFKIINHITFWAGKNIFHIDHLKIAAIYNSRDTTFDYVNLVVFPVIALSLSFLIIAIDKKRINYEKINYWLIIYIRYCIGLYMLIYGLDKVFKSHFPFPDLMRLEQTYGNSSPQGMLWACLGYSKSYTVFIGLMEILSGSLLFFRRTTAFGAFMVLLIMINVLIVNLSYDVPVKLFAMHIILYSIIILYPNLRTLFQFFFSGKPSALVSYSIQPTPLWLMNLRKVVKPIVLIGFFLIFTRNSINNMNTYGDHVPQPPLYGIYKTKTFSISNDTLNAMHWDELIIDKKATAIRYINGAIKHYSAATDTINKTIRLTSFADTKKQYFFKYDLKDDVLTIRGKKNNDSLIVTFKKVDLNDFLLLNRGFHWINDDPINR